MKYQKIILTDVDGVLLDWEWAFNVWMQEHGFELTDGYQYEYDMATRYDISKEQVRKLIRTFNESAAIGFLPVLRDAMYWVKRLHEQHGYTFHAITSLSLNENAGKLREMNLEKMFLKGNPIFFLFEKFYKTPFWPNFSKNLSAISFEVGFICFSFSGSFWFIHKFGHFLFKKLFKRDRVSAN